MEDIPWTWTSGKDDYTLDHAYYDLAKDLIPSVQYVIEWSILQPNSVAPSRLPKSATYLHWLGHTEGTVDEKITRKFHWQRVQKLSGEPLWALLPPSTIAACAI